MENEIKEIDYDEINSVLKEIFNKDYCITKENAKEKLKDIIYDRALKISEVENLKEQFYDFCDRTIELININDEREIFCNSLNNAEILLDKLYDVTIEENMSFVINLIINEDILEVLSDELTNFIDISILMKKFEQEENYKCDLSDMCDAIFEVIEQDYIQDINKDELIEMINDSVKDFVSEEKVKKFYF